MKITPEQVVEMMKDKFGEGMPKSVTYLSKVSPEAVLLQVTSSADSMSDENSPFDMKYRTFLYLAAALATNSQSCIKAHSNSALKLGATKDELLAVIKIVRHFASSNVYGNAEYILKKLMEK